MTLTVKPHHPITQNADTQTRTRLTSHQQAVLNLLTQQFQPVSAQNLYVLMREEREIGLATIYRAMETLRLRGLVQSRTDINGESLYSPVERDQHYLTCLQCSQSFPLDCCPMETLETHLHPTAPFTIYYHTLEFFGLCEPCTSQPK
jgi:Fur family transcriptional regulator, ferric uptake regulator